MVKELNISNINSYYDNISWDKLENFNVSQTGKWNVRYKGKDWKNLRESIVNRGFKDSNDPSLYIALINNKYYVYDGNHRIRTLKEIYNNNNYKVTVYLRHKDKVDKDVFNLKKKYYEEAYNGTKSRSTGSNS